MNIYITVENRTFIPAKSKILCISRHMNDRDDIPTAIPIHFRGRSVQGSQHIDLIADIDRPRKYKMAAAKPEIVYVPFYTR
jgi:hypothetical protein